MRGVVGVDIDRCISTSLHVQSCIPICTCLDLCSSIYNFNNGMYLTIKSPDFQYCYIPPVTYAFHVSHAFDSMFAVTILYVLLSVYMHDTAALPMK